MPFISADDGTRLHYEDTGSGRPLVLLHGWGFSRRFFHRSVAALSLHARVISVDLRGHGDSDKPDHGYRVARLAADLRDLLVGLDLTDATVLGWSLGCPAIWSYLELFGTARLAQAVFVQQVPRQYIAEDWPHFHATCFDQAALMRLQTEVALDPDFESKQLDLITEVSVGGEERAMLLAEMAKAPAAVRIPMMADNTSQDWRDLLPHVRLPVLVLAARKDPNFSAEGVAWVGDTIPGARTVHFDHSSHALFLDETEKFNETVLGFLAEIEAPR